MRKSFAIATVSVLVALAVPAQAHKVVVTDGDDVTGKFDMSETSMDHTTEKIILSTKVRSSIQPANFTEGNYFSWRAYTETETTARFQGPLQWAWELYLEARQSEIARSVQGGELRMKCFVFTMEGQVYKGRGLLTERRGTCKIPRSLFGGLPDAFSAHTSYDGKLDNAPNDGSELH